MRRNKGFTLIELLAVIVILAIVALISTPIILNVINNSKENAAKDKAWGTIEAVKYKYYEDSNSADNNVTLPYVVTFNGTANDKGVKISGDKPTKGTVTVSKEGVITCAGLEFAGFTCKTDDGNTMTCDTK